ncbi:uncharacterized protein LOC110068429 [Orbicella faveolata]|uniref:uncharacterized protein LOC110068429 n=1 Tax=Orbicella faveolata TaxID=48498 RepID=UPI0009E2AECB|nr:uncharacterized protein LOC110068429 [Orbicella faveolata]
MSQVVTKRVVLYSSDSSEHPYVISNNNEDELLKTETLSSDTNKAIELDVGSNQGSEIVLNVQSDEEPMASKTFVKTETSRKVIHTYVTDTGEPQEFTIQTAPVVTTSLNIEKHGKQVQNDDTNIKQIFETELRSHPREPNEQTSSKIQIESPTYIPTKTNQQHIIPTNQQANETNSQSTNSSKTSNPRTSIKSCYTYRVKDGVAILENVTKYQSRKQTKKERSHPQKTTTYTDYQQIDGNEDSHSVLTKTQTLAKTTSLVKEIKQDGQSSQEKETYTWSTEEHQINSNNKENDHTSQGEIQFLPIKNTQNQDLRITKSQRQRQKNSQEAVLLSVSTKNRSLWASPTLKVHDSWT